MKKDPIRQVNPQMPLSTKVAMRSYARAEFKGQKTTHSRSDPPRLKSKYGLKVLMEIDRYRFHTGLPKHSQSNLDYRTKAKFHSGNLSMQPVPLSKFKLSAKNSFNLMHGIAKLAILIVVAQVARSLF